MIVKNRIFVYLSISFLGLLLLTFPVDSNQNKGIIITIDDFVINPVTAEYIIKTIKRAESEKAECLIVELDTPGGLLNSTRGIVKAILNADVPIIVYVAPSGSRAGSAGVFITMASHIAAMSPSTNIGAAHPVGISRKEKGWGETLKELLSSKKDEEEDEQKKQSDEDIMSEKVMKDTIAWITTIAKKRGRNEEWARKAVQESESITEDVAIQENVVEIIAKNRDELLEKIDGKRVSLPSGEKILNTKGLHIEIIPLSGRQKILNTLINPNIAYILMILGFYGLLFEVTHPGIGFPGIAGVICLILALYAFHTLPTNYAGIALIILGIILFIAEVNVPSFGLLTLGGVVSMTLGSLILFDSPYSFLRVSLSIIIPLVAATAVITIFLIGAVIRAHRRKSAVGKEGLVGEEGTCEVRIAPEGKVFVHGEIWDAVSEEVIEKGEKVLVQDIKKMKLKVKKI